MKMPICAEKLIKGIACVAFSVGMLKGPGARGADDTLLNVSYDVSREFYQEFNAAFVKHWRAKTGRSVQIRQSHGGSSKQARAVIDGLEADVVTMNQAMDIFAIARLGKQVSPDWRSRFPSNSAPYTSTIVFLAREGNPKNIRDWDDLVRPGIKVILPNPKTSGNGRYTYLAAYGHALVASGGNAEAARSFVSKLLAQAPVFDTGGRAATTTFAQRGIGDVLVTFESEVFLAVREFGSAAFEVIYPRRSIDAEAPVAVVDKVVDKRGTRALAAEYLSHLYSVEAQEIAARHYLRPRIPEVARKYADRFPSVELFTVDEVFGGWEEAERVHFAAGGVLDQLLSRRFGP
jgi:sulfate transport system substrate-binding protein